MKRLTWIKAMTGLTLVTAGWTTRGAVLEVGQPFPVIALPTMSDGRPMSVADFRGHKLLLHLYAPW